MTRTVFIDGAAGTTGLEIVERLSGRSEFSLVILSDEDRKDTSKRREALNDSDFAILCLPDDAARDAVSMIDVESNTRVIDASSAHRVADGWTYGFPEIIGRETVAEAKFVSNPGCYPTGFLALMAPLTAPIQAIKSPMDPQPIGNPTTILPLDWAYSVNAVSGYSGGGKSLIERFEKETNIAYRAYGLSLNHKHVSEMQKYADLKHPPVFSPSVIPGFRGMIVDVPMPLEAMGFDNSRVLENEWDMWYENEPLIRLHYNQPRDGELLINTDAEPWDGLELYLCANDSNTQARLIARLDNLGKGASGAAIQNLNLMARLPEVTGLRI